MRRTVSHPRKLRAGTRARPASSRLPTPTLTLAKSASPATYVKGTVTHYTYLVTNSGGTTFAGPVTVTDDKVSVVTCPAVPAGGLTPSFSITCTADHTATQADVDAGSIVNTATAHSNGTDSNTDTRP